jgi:putative ABC transport system substrate-binding protein
VAGSGAGAAARTHAAYRRAKAYAQGDAEAEARIAALQEGLKERGWLEGHTVQFDIRWAAANADRRRSQAEELVNNHPDVIVANTASVVVAIKRVTNIIPIVYAAGADPVVSGLVTSLAVISPVSP